MSSAHALKMDRIYGPQRLIYDATRAYYLLGRNQLLQDLRVPAGGAVLEIGCGTGRNLIKASARLPQARLYGIDISREMLRSAEAAVERAGLSGRLSLAQADAERFDPAPLFGVERFDCVFFSYTLSMIPDWQAALKQALDVLKPTGSLHLVDFGDCSGLPGWFKAGLLAWLEKFHVSPRADMAEVLHDLASRAARPITVTKPFRGYAISATLAGQTQRLPDHAQARP